MWRESYVPVPPLAEQRRIAWVLGALDDKIELNRKMAKTLEETARRVWLEITAELSTTQLSKVGSQIKNPAQPSDKPTSDFEQFSIPSFDQDKAPEVCLGESMKSGKTELPNAGAVLVSKLNPDTWRAWIARPSGRGTPVCSPEFVALTADDRAKTLWISGVALFDPGFRSEVLSNVTGTTGSRQRVKPADILGSKIPEPREPVLKQWASLAGPLFDHAASLQQEVAVLQNLRDELLPKLISGAIRVPESVGPASDADAVVEELAEA